ncbi:MAG: HEPN domain-containing protein [Nitrospirota bacterium]
MADPEVVGQWLARADEDLAFAEANLREGSTFYAQICFHFHQAAEKYLKAFIVAHDLEFEKLHNLMHLLRLCAKQNPSLTRLLDHCETLNTAYIDTRYPVHWPTNYTKAKALRAEDSARAIATAIKAALNV